MEDLERAIKLGKEKVILASLDYPVRETILDNLSACFYSRYEQSETIGDPERDIEFGKEAIATTTPGQPHRSVLLINLS